SDRVRRIGLCIAAYGLGILIGTIYWLPSLTEVKYTQLDNSISTAFDVRNHFKSLSEILGHTPMLDRTAYNPYRPLNIGLVQVMLAAAGFLTALWPKNRLMGWQRGHVLAASLGLIGCIFLMTDVSLWVWENVPFAERLSFPWRLLGMTAFLIVPGAAIWVDVISAKWKQILALAAMAFIIVSLLPAMYRIGGYFPAFEGRVTAADAQRYEAIGVLGMTGENEYLPRWTDFQNRPAAQPDYALYENLDWFFPVWEESIPPDATVRQLEKSNHRTGESFDIKSDSAFPLQIRQMYFPGWKATLDGKAIRVYPQGRQGLATVDIPAGNHRLDIWYAGTRNQQVSMWVTLVGLMICAGLYLAEAGRRRVTPILRTGLKPVPTFSSKGHDRLSFAVIFLSLLFLIFNQVYLIPHTRWFRPEKSLTAPDGMETPVGVQFFQPGIGYRLELIGYTLKQDEIDDDVQVSLYWRALQPMDGTPRLNLSLTSRDQTQVYGLLSTYNLGFAVESWPTDKYVIHQVRLELSPDVPPTIGVLRLKIFDDSAIWRTSQETEEIVLQEIRITGEGWDEIPEATQTANIQFGDSLTLKAVQVTPQAESLGLTLYWEVRSTLSRDYTLFLHFQQQGETITQADQPPLGINYPTSEWREGEKLISYLTLPLPPEADSLLVGLFDSETMQRLPISEAEMRVEQDGVLLSLEN
ncbi:MAG: hypothetical protein K8I82_15105, partial [Anaerolineae bacterium]|nr:hypothetical protein [Anaerolineae bacterium]